MYLGVCEAISCNFVSELTTISFFLFVKFETRKRNYPTSSVVMKLQETFQILTIIVISSLSSMHSIIRETINSIKTLDFEQIQQNSQKFFQSKFQNVCLRFY